MTDILLLTFIFLVAGVVAVPVASKLGLGSVLGYLIAGIAISPLLALLNVDVVAIQHFAEFGVVMMLFLVGLELEPRALWDMRARLLGLGGGQIGLTTLAVMGVALAFGLPWTVALAVGLVLALSSTAIVLQTLNEKGLMRSDGGQSSFAVLLTQDIAVIPMLALLPLLAMPDLAAVGNDTVAPIVAEQTESAHGTGDHGEGSHETDALGAEAHGDDGHGDGHGSGLSLVEGLEGWQTALVTLGAVAAVVVGGALLTGPLFRFISAAHLRELFVAGALMLVVGIALLMSLVGLSPALGTFIAGVVLANSPYRHELESDIDPFRGLLLGLFFMTVGAGVNFAMLFADFGAFIGLTLLLIAIKAGVLLILARIFGLTEGDKWLFALGLAQAGEFGFVLLSFTVANSVLPQALSDQLLLIVALSMLLTPALFILYDRVIAPRFAEEQERDADEMPDGRRILIAGAGRVGGTIDRILRVGGHECTVIDYNSRRLQILERFGTRHYFGDAARPDLLHAAGIEEAQVFVVAIDGRDQITELVRYVREAHPKVHVVARAMDRDHVYDLWSVGCRDIVRETYDGTLRMGRSVFEAVGHDRAVAQALVDQFNLRDRESMITAASVHKFGVPPHENEEYVRLIRDTRGDWEARLTEEMAEIVAGKVAPKKG